MKSNFLGIFFLIFNLIFKFTKRIKKSKTGKCNNQIRDSLKVFLSSLNFIAAVFAAFLALSPASFL